MPKPFRPILDARLWNSPEAIARMPPSPGTGFGSLRALGSGAAQLPMAVVAPGPNLPVGGQAEGVECASAQDLTRRHKGSAAAGIHEGLAAETISQWR